MSSMQWLPCLLLFALSWVRSVAVYDPDLKVETARLYGNIVGYAYWYVDVAVGTPPQRVSVILDTGSGLLAFPCSGCEHCGADNHIDPLFNVANSSTAEWLKCNTDKCHGDGCGPANQCLYTQGYLEGSSIKGYYFEDFISLGDTFQENPPVKARLGCHTKETKLFYTQKANGIFGIQGHTSVLQNYFHDQTHVNSKIFSICLSSNGGQLTVGGLSSISASKPVQWTALQSTMYTVGLTKVEADGSHVGPFGMTLVDSGTTFTYFASSHYKWFTKVIDDHCAKSAKCGTLDKGCWNGADLAAFPVLHFHFKPDVVVDWHPREYLYRSGHSTPARYCYGFKNDGNTRTTTLGATFILYKEVVFNLDAKKIGFVPAECPEHDTRPKVPSLEPKTVDAVTTTSTTSSVSTWWTDSPATEGTTTALPLASSRAEPVATTSTTAEATLGKTVSSTSASQGNASALIQRDDEEEVPTDSSHHWWEAHSLSPAMVIIPVLVLMFITAVAATACIVKPKPVTLSSVQDPPSDADTVGLKSSEGLEKSDQP